MPDGAVHALLQKTLHDALYACLQAWIGPQDTKVVFRRAMGNWKATVRIPLAPPSNAYMARRARQQRAVGEGFSSAQGAFPDYFQCVPRLAVLSLVVGLLTSYSAYRDHQFLIYTSYLWLSLY